MGGEFWSPGTQSMDTGTGAGSGWARPSGPTGTQGVQVGVQPEEGQRRATMGPEQGLSLPRSESDTAFHSPLQPPRTVSGSPGPLLLSLSARAALPAPLVRNESVQEPGLCWGVAGCPWLPGFAQKRGESAAAPARARRPGVCEEDSRSVQSV